MKKESKNKSKNEIRKIGYRKEESEREKMRRKEGWEEGRNRQGVVTVQYCELNVN